MLLAAAGAVSVAVWLYLLAARGAFWRMREARPEGVLPATAPSVVAVVPARNEAETVGRAVASLAAQRYPGAFHMVVVDDASADGTAEAARAAASPAILTVIRGRPLPSGWSGKLWAVDQGVREAARFSPDYLLLTDADIEHPPGNLAALVARAESGLLDLVSYMATLRCRALAERALVPAFVFFFFMLYPPAWVADPRRATAGAAGGCMLVKRAALERIGGLAAIRGELIDDCALARAMKAGGGRVWLGLSAATHSLRGYAGFAEIGRMISRTAFTQLRYSAALLAGTAAAIGHHLSAASGAGAGGAGGAARWLGVAAWAMMAGAWLPRCVFTGAPRCGRRFSAGGGFLSGRHFPLGGIVLARPGRHVERAGAGQGAPVKGRRQAESVPPLRRGSGWFMVKPIAPCPTKPPSRGVLPPPAPPPGVHPGIPADGFLAARPTPRFQAELSAHRPPGLPEPVAGPGPAGRNGFPEPAREIRLPPRHYGCWPRPTRRCCTRISISS